MSTAVIDEKVSVIDYDELVDELAAKLVAHYGSVAEFTRHKDFLDLGYTLADSDKIQTYFATSRTGKRRTKSAKLMVMLAGMYLERKITIKTRVTKQQFLLEDKD